MCDHKILRDYKRCDSFARYPTLNAHATALNDYVIVH